MRRPMIALYAVLFATGASGAAGAGWHYLRPHDKLAEARQLMAVGDVRSAELLLRSLVQDTPGLTEAHVRLGESQLRMNDPVAAEKQFGIARGQGWDLHALTPLLAQAVVSQGRYDEVLRDYTVDGLTPEQAANTLVARAGAELGLGRMAQAADTMAQARRLAPQSLEVALAASRQALARNDLPTAATSVQVALAIDPHALEAFMIQAALRVADGDTAGALASYAMALTQAQALKAGAVIDMVHLGRARLLLNLQDDAAARVEVDAAISSQPHSPLANFLSASLLARAGDWKGAGDALTKVGPALSRMPHGDLLLAAVKINLNEPEQAIAAAERQVARTPGDIASVKLLAGLEMSQKRPDLAIRVLMAAGPLDAEGLNLLGNAYAAGGQTAKAVSALKQVSALTPDDTRILTRLAVLQLSMGKPDQALKALDRALDISTAAQGAAAVIPVVAQTPGADGASSANAARLPPAATAQPASPTQVQTAAALIMASLQAGEIERAVAVLQTLQDSKADPINIAMLSGTVKLAQIDLTGAEAAFRSVVAMDPKAIGGRIELARVLTLQGRAAEAIAMLEEVLDMSPQNGPALTMLVTLLLESDQPAKAIATAERAQRSSPGALGLTIGLAELYLRTDHADKALALLDAGQAGSRALPSPGLLGLRAQAQMVLGQRPAAEKTLRTLLDTTPEDVGLRRQLAEMLAGDKDYGGANALLQDGLGRTPGDTVLIAASVAVAGSEGGPDAAVARAEALARDPGNPAAATLKGDVLLSQHRYPEALTTYRARLASLPKDDPMAGALQIRAAEAVANGGDPAGAATLLRNWLQGHPDDIGALLALSTLDLTAGRLPDARSRLEAVLAQSPNHPAALNNLAWISQRQGDLPRARTLAARAYLLGPSPQSADTLGWIVLAQGQPTDAVPLLRNAASSQPGDPAMHYHLAAALAEDGQKAAAVTLLKAVTAAPGTFDEEAQAVALLARLTGP